MQDDIVRQPPSEESQQPPAEETPVAPVEAPKEENVPEVASDAPQTKSNKPVAVIALAVIICLALIGLTVYAGMS